MLYTLKCIQSFAHEICIDLKYRQKIMSNIQNRLQSISSTISSLLQLLSNSLLFQNVKVHINVRSFSHYI